MRGKRFKVDENTVGFFERFLGSDVIPKPGQGPGMDRGAGRATESCVLAGRHCFRLSRIE